MSLATSIGAVAKVLLSQLANMFLFKIVLQSCTCALVDKLDRRSKGRCSQVELGARRQPIRIGWSGQTNRTLGLSYLKGEG